MPILRIRNWREHQHYKDRNPPWIKVHRSLLEDPDWFALPDSAARLLVELWLVASGTKDGSLPEPRKLAFRLRRDSEALAEDLKALVDNDFLECASGVLASACPEGETEGETETETTAPNGREDDVENSETMEPTPTTPPTANGTQTGREDDRPTYTRAALAEAALKTLGLGRLSNADQAANKRILNDWLYRSSPRDPFEVMLAIEGASEMRDKDLIGWDSAKPGDPMTLKALNGPVTLADQGDGRAQRTLYDVAVEYARERDEKPRKRRSTLDGGSLRSIRSITKAMTA